MGIVIDRNGASIDGKNIGSIYQLIISGAPCAMYVYRNEMYYPLNHIEIAAHPGLHEKLRALTVDECGAAFPHLLTYEDSAEPYIRADELDAWIISQTPLVIWIKAGGKPEWNDPSLKP